MDALIAIIPLAAGYLLDRIFGDPAWLPHPVVGFGKMISFCERKMNGGGYRVAKGAVVAVSLIALTFLLTWLLMKMLSPWLPLKIIVESILVFCFLAGTTLIREVRDVFRACGVSLEKGRRQVARIVGRDTENLTGHEVKTAALETLAENLSDGVVAPLFWYLLLGIPGMAAYKMVNTLDSMIGYRSERYRQFGKVAARIDDVANFLPARITAFLMLLVAGRLNLTGFVIRFGHCHASPNSGYPEAALAGIIDTRFGGTHDYFGQPVYKPYIGVTDRALTDSDLSRSLAVCRRAGTLAVILSAALTALASVCPLI